MKHYVIDASFSVYAETEDEAREKFFAVLPQYVFNISSRRDVSLDWTDCEEDTEYTFYQLTEGEELTNVPHA